MNRKLSICFASIVLLNSLIIAQTKSIPPTIMNESNENSEKIPPDILVIYYSSTGNTGVMGEEIAKEFHADVINIKSETYDEGIWTSFKAGLDAWNEERRCNIDPETVDVSKYRIIFLGSPIWWYRPAVPLWTFVEMNDFTGKRIVLFNTFNSRFKEEYIEEFKDLVEDKGGEFYDHIYVRRGRWYNQFDRDELVIQIKQLLDTRKVRWQSMILEE
ncbi:hypothetical protein CEE37_08465 [candidate division LCP-89 bacterium B3_LCP]|uniref:Flavodoxin-like domain-containing protein n=1 Tax=candidate division LCP-89 bacterium B3_LCP TaxID=2012998 RepID=A0A532UZH5_UNCL8|nr:MAG: hypothetical protein CEE37_08465 [candidate division LCP-89 bacterium B3_LCP]